MGYGMWYPVDGKSLSSNLPPMVVFPEEGVFYENWRKKLVERGVKVRLNTEVDAVLERSKKGVKVQTRQRRQQEDLHNPSTQEFDVDQDMPTAIEEYDRCPASPRQPGVRDRHLDQGRPLVVPARRQVRRRLLLQGQVAVAPGQGGRLLQGRRVGQEEGV